jgi:hypothetical protein
MAAGGEHEDVPPVPLSRCICLTHNVVSSPGEGRERPPRFYSTPLSASGVGCRERRSLKLEGFGAGLTDLKPERLSLSWPAKVVTQSPLAGHPAAGLSFTSKNSGPFPWAEIQCLGLQSYSRLLGLSREKHHMLYPQQ